MGRATPHVYSGSLGGHIVCIRHASFLFSSWVTPSSIFYFRYVFEVQDTNNSRVRQDGCLGLLDEIGYLGRQA
jgi:hypothetical protein